MKEKLQPFLFCVYHHRDLLFDQVDQSRVTVNCKDFKESSSLGDIRSIQNFCTCDLRDHYWTFYNNCDIAWFDRETMNFLKPPEQRPRRRSLQAIPDEKEVKEFFDEDNAEMALLKMLQQNSRRRVSLPNPQVKYLDPSSEIPQPRG